MRSLGLFSNLLRSLLLSIINKSITGSIKNPPPKVNRYTAGMYGAVPKYMRCTPNIPNVRVNTAAVIFLFSVVACCSAPMSLMSFGCCAVPCKARQLVSLKLLSVAVYVFSCVGATCSALALWPRSINRVAKSS